MIRKTGQASGADVTLTLAAADFPHLSNPTTVKIHRIACAHPADASVKQVYVVPAGGTHPTNTLAAVACYAEGGDWEFSPPVVATFASGTAGVINVVLDGAAAAGTYHLTVWASGG